MEFDRRWGVDTCGIILPDKSEVVGKNWVYGTRYQGIDPVSLEGALKALTISYKDFTFIDFGSGKGRAILVASRFPFKKVIGVEYCPRLNSVARKNIVRFPHSEKQCTDLELVCTDAASYPIPDGALLIFLFNPFGRTVMKELIGNIERSLREDPRETMILYGNPVHETLWADAGFRKENGTPRWLSIYRAPF
ncbi:MAG: class I SAM-dependent methyltransferase [Syntrophorhabdaceae bacterium]